MAAKQSLSFALEPRASATLDDFVLDCAWSPDSRRLAVAGGEGKVALGAPAGGSFSLAVLGEHLLGTLALAWQPHGGRFATSGQDRQVALWDAEGGREFLRWKPGNETGHDKKQNGDRADVHRETQCDDTGKPLKSLGSGRLWVDRPFGSGLLSLHKFRRHVAYL